MNQELEPITKETMGRLNLEDREDAISKYHKWIKEVRKDEVRQSINLRCKIYNHRHKGYIRITQKAVGHSCIYKLGFIRNSPYYTEGIFFNER